MTRQRRNPRENAREQSREDQAKSPGEVRQNFGNRDFQRGTQRNETQIEGGIRRDDAGNVAPGKRRTSRH